MAVSITKAISTRFVTILIEFIGNPHGCKELKKVPATKILITVNQHTKRMASDVQETGTDIVTDDDGDTVTDPDPILDLEFDEDEDDINVEQEG